MKLFDGVPDRLVAARMRSFEPAGALALFSALHFAAVAVIGGLAVAAAPVLAAGLPVALAVNLVFSATVYRLLRTSAPFSFGHARLGACNVVTHLRGSLAALLAMPLAAPQALADPAVGWAVFGLGLTVLCLDGVDGWLARRGGMASAFGARFDMEVDSLLALALAVLALASGAAGPAVLVLGLARYAFWAASLVLPWLAAPLPPRFSRKAVCVVQLGTLLALQAPVLPASVGHAAAFAAAGLLAWSFWVDIRWLSARAARS